VIKTLSNAYSEKYVASTMSVYQQFNVFRESLLEFKSVFSPIEMGIMFIQRKMDIGALQVQSAHQYCVNVKAALNIFEGVQLELEPNIAQWRMFQRALRRAGALVPKNQAPPLTFEELGLVMKRTKGKLRLAVSVGWQTSARGADLRCLTPERITVELENEFTFDFRGTKTDPFQEGLYIRVAFPASLAAEFRDLLRRTAPTQPLFEFENVDITEAIRTATGNSKLSAHSIRRGSLQHLLMKGASIQDIMKHGRYKTESGLFHYLQLARLPYLQRQAEVSKLLHQC
jgi:hypothetical protein